MSASGSVTDAAAALAGRRILVVGMGRSGVAAAQLCAQVGARVTITDQKAAEALDAAVAALPAEIARELGGHRLQSFTGADLIVLSPGVPPLAEVAAARAAGVPVIGELELGARFVEAPIIAITGTNGKSTTTTLVGEMMSATGRPTFVGGNLGVPLCEAAFSAATAAAGSVVLEVSSFQLETIDHFHPHVAVLLNVTPDHLDRYDGMNGYAAAKARVFENQRADDFAIVNVDDPVVDGIGRTLTAAVVPLSTRRRLTAGAWVEGDELCLQLPGAAIERYPAVLPGLVGRHNQENALAASLAARLAGVSAEIVRAALLDFQPLAHRMTLVGQAGGVDYYDDSKGTNVGAVVAAIDGFPRPVVLIAGGRDKGGSYQPLAAVLAKVGRGAVLIGEAAERIAAAIGDAVPTVRAASLDEAVQAAAGLARPGDAVVLSPACSSFDMFRNYAERGDVFRAAVGRLSIENQGGTR